MNATATWNPLHSSHLRKPSFQPLCSIADRTVITLCFITFADHAITCEFWTNKPFQHIRPAFYLPWHDTSRNCMRNGGDMHAQSAQISNCLEAEIPRFEKQKHLSRQTKNVIQDAEITEMWNVQRSWLCWKIYVLDVDLHIIFYIFIWFFDTKLKPCI